MNIHREALADLMQDYSCALDSLTIIPFTETDEEEWKGCANQYWTLISCDIYGGVSNGTHHRLEVHQNGTNHYLPKEGD